MSVSGSFAWQLTRLNQQNDGLLLVVVKNNRELSQLGQAIQFFDSAVQVLSFNDWETLPYERLSPAPYPINQRLKTLHQLTYQPKGILITTLTGLLQYLAPKEYIAGYVFQFAIGDQLEIMPLVEKLSHCGYQRVETVTFPGEFALKGSVIDIFSFDTKRPFRVHVDFDRIENLYYFNATTQEPDQPLEAIHIMPTREFLLSDASIDHFKQKGAQLLGKHFLDSVINQQLSTTGYPAGIESYLPLFFENTHTLVDYLPPHTRWVTALDLHEELAQHWQHIESRYHELRHDIQRPILRPHDLYQSLEQTLSALNTFEQASLFSLPLQALPDLHCNNPLEVSYKLKAFLEELSSKETMKVVFCTKHLSQQDTLIQHLQLIDIIPTSFQPHQNDFKTSTYQIAIAPIQQGFWSKKEKLVVIPDTALYGKLLSNTLEPVIFKKDIKYEEAFHSLAQLKVNDLIVHIDHGIGRYLGLHQVQIGQQLSEFIVLAYALDAKLYLPIQEVQSITRYAGQDTPSLNELNNNRWSKTKQKTLIQIKDTAAELLDLYAQRAKAEGEAFKLPDKDYEAFANAFEFEETPDQARTIQAVINDLCQPKPMDRLICGDVGFGKTEIAMRAAFLAVKSDKQVAILAPTTLLADQHYRSFRERFSDWPIVIEGLSRFRTTSESRNIKERLKKGMIDIIIGTHALLSKQINFKALGLVIIDEEHHFGVQQKERIKALKTQVHILTLTATPIPRTLQSALSGLRELSLITTPPPNRLPIQNFIVRRESSTLKEAMLRELLRGGQIYFVHNRVTSLSRVAKELQALIPEAKIAIAHGQLSEKKLEACMEGFHQQKYNVLVCTSIIETGIDIPNVNTLIVDRANHFGLAQLHQLRGRVGRSHHQAYAYFLVSEESTLTRDAHKRLEALKSLTQLGSGFSLANHDLDIRGAGELLGDKQSGTMQGVGFSLYMELLEKAVEMIKNGQSLDSLVSTTPNTSINLNIPAFIPEAYLPDVSLRLQYYKRITKTHDQLSLQHIQSELIDRYGLLPKPIQYLFAITELKQIVQPCGITKIEANTKGGWLEFSKQPSINPARIIELVQKEPRQFKLTPSQSNDSMHLRFYWNNELSTVQKIDFFRKLVERLT